MYVYERKKRKRIDGITETNNTKVTREKKYHRQIKHEILQQQQQQQNTNTLLLLKFPFN